jgi:hypothetical protein
LRQYFTFYNHEQLHQSLGYQPPAAVYHREGGGKDARLGNLLTTNPIKPLVNFTSPVPILVLIMEYILAEPFVHNTGGQYEAGYTRFTHTIRLHLERERQGAAMRKNVPRARSFLTTMFLEIVLIVVLTGLQGVQSALSQTGPTGPTGAPRPQGSARP